MKYGSAGIFGLHRAGFKRNGGTGLAHRPELGRRKGAAPIMDEDFIITSAMLAQRPEMKKTVFKSRAKGQRQSALG